MTGGARINHEEIQELIPAYGTGRLAPEVRGVVAAHLLACAECGEMARTCGEIAAALREGGERLFEPHPGEDELRDFAKGVKGERTDAIRRHLEVCMTCSLEVQAWSGRGRFAPGLAPVPATGPGRRRIAFVPVLSAAAGLLLGFGIAFVLMRREAALPVAAPAQGVQPPAPAEVRQPEGAWTGRAPQWILPGATRGEAPAVSMRLGAEDRYVVVSFRPSLPAELPDGEACRFEILGEGGAVWSSEVPARAVRADLERNDCVTFVVPAAALSGRSHEFIASAPSGTGRSILYRIAMRIDRAP